jgi:hypothetical protein
MTIHEKDCIAQWERFQGEKTLKWNGLGYAANRWGPKPFWPFS